MLPATRGVGCKLRNMEEQANAVSAELEPGLARTPLLHIVVLAQTLRVRLQFGRVVVVREPA